MAGFRIITVLGMACLGFLAATALEAAQRPHVLMIAIDDQNDWIGCLGGHPLVKTPQLDRLASRGTLFSNAHCQAPLCNPSRTSLLLGLRPSTTGIYGLAPYFRQTSEWRDRVPLPQYFQQQGYRTASIGKIFHGGAAKREFEVVGEGGGVGIKPSRKLVSPTPMGNHPLVDWGVFPHRDEEKGDYQITTWALQQLQQANSDEPLFLSVGYFLPHVPCYATQRWFDLYPDDDTVLPQVLDGDRDDTPRFSWYLHWSLPEPRLKWVRDAGQWRNLVRSYLACVSFVDDQIGRLLEGLEQSPLKDNTIVVVWGDHGWHLGEKGITGKNTLWERSTRVPLIFAGPGVASDATCRQPVELLDIYPTLVELCGLPPRDDLEGHSVVPQLQDATQPRPWPAITTHNQGNHSVRTERWRFIRYADGSEELYDTRSDPNEWKNVAGDTSVQGVLSEHRKWLPQPDVPPVANSAQRVLTYEARTGTATWEGTEIGKNDPVPE